MDARPPEWDGWLNEAAQLLAEPPLSRRDQQEHGPEDPKFKLGDFLCTVPSQYVKALALALNESPARLRLFRDTADKLPPEARVKASWSTHRDLRNTPELLSAGLTVRKAGAAAGKPPIDAQPDRFLSVEDRASKARAFLADPDVYAVIEKEMTQSRIERQIRHKARVIHSDLAKKQRELDAEARALREAKSPFEATVKAELDLNKAAQLVHAVGATMDDLPQPERLTQALAELGAEVTTALSLQAKADTHSGIVIDIET